MGLKVFCVVVAITIALACRVKCPVGFLRSQVKSWRTAVSCVVGICRVDLLVRIVVCCRETTLSSPAFR